MGPGTATKKTKWSDLNMDEKINYLLREVKNLTYQVSSRNKLIENLLRHQHDYIKKILQDDPNFFCYQDKSQDVLYCHGILTNIIF